MIYDAEDLEVYRADDLIDDAEEGFMHGYLGRWRPF